jgi:phosphohistidine phosphatase SixA
MHELLLLRHAAAMPAPSDGRDSDRPLNTRGESEAREAGAWLREQGVRPDRVLCSPSQRTVMTATAVLREIADMPDPVLDPAIYDAVPGTLIELIDRHADADTLLVIGHNPGMEQLVGLLTEGVSTAARGIPPAGLAWLRTEAPLQPGTAILHAFWSP